MILYKCIYWLFRLKLISAKNANRLADYWYPVVSK